MSTFQSADNLIGFVWKNTKPKTASDALCRLNEVKEYHNTTTTSYTDSSVLFGKCTQMDTVEFTEITTITTEGEVGMFSRCSALKNLSMPKLKNITRKNGLMFLNSCPIEVLNLPELQSLQQQNSSGSGTALFNNLPQLRTVNLPKLSYPGYAWNCRIFDNIGVAELSLPGLVLEGDGLNNVNIIFNSPNITLLKLENLKKIYSYQDSFAGNCPMLETILMPSLIKYLNTNAQITNLTGLKKMVLGKMQTMNYSPTGSSVPKLIHYEFGSGTNCSIRLDLWSPTTALDASSSSLVDEGETFANNREKFIYNFQHYILDRLQVGANKTLTVSSAVYSAVSGLTMPSGWTLASA